MTDILYKDLSYKIIGYAMKVHATLGKGFLEKDYENALMVEFRRAGIQAEQQSLIKVIYESEIVGDYRADTLVENKLFWNWNVWIKLQIFIKHNQ